MDVTVPPGCGAGSSVTFVDAAGCELTTTVPDGLVEGDIFRVAAPIPDWIEEILESLTQDKFSFVLDKYVEDAYVPYGKLGPADFVAEQARRAALTPPRGTIAHTNPNPIASVGEQARYAAGLTQSVFGLQMLHLLGKVLHVTRDT